jgi:hypothetical protein
MLSSCLLKINNKQVKRLNPLNDYKRLLTYFGILKNKKFLSHPGEGVVPIIHFTSSEYYVENQCEALTQLKFKYLKYASEQLKFRVIITDCAWSSIHSILTVFNNNQDIHD